MSISAAVRWLTCMGDSMTNTESTLGIPESRQYPHLVATAIGGACSARNLGVPGDTTGQMLARVDTMLDPVPSVTVIWGGINDYLQGVDGATTQRNLEQLVDAALAAGCRRVLLCSIHRLREADVDSHYTAKRDVARSVADKKRVAFCDLHAVTIADEEYHPDGVHLEPAGLQRIADAVKARLDKLGWSVALHGEGLDREPLPEEVPYAPGDGESVSVNPPPLVWPPAPDAERYIVQISRTPLFEGAAVYETDLCHLVLPHPLTPGLWYWRFGVEGQGWGRSRTFTIPEAAVPFPFPDLEKATANVPVGRPRLFVREGELQRFRERWQASPELTADMYQQAESFLGGPLLPEPAFLPPVTDPNYAPVYVQTFRATRPFTASMHDCALAYLFSGDRRYGEEARRRLLHLMTWDPEGSTCLFHNDETAMEFVSLVPRAFDWIYDLLTDEERDQVSQVMRVRLAQVYRRLREEYQFHARPYDSHAGRSLGFLGEGALAFIHEFPEARQWLEYILRIFWTIYPAWGGAPGGWSEGPAYWVWYMKWATTWCEVLRRATGVDLYQKPFFRNTPYFQLYGRPPYSKLSPFGDGQDNGVPLDAGLVMYRFGSAYRDPYLAWYPQEQGARPSGMELFWYDPHLQVRSPGELPQARCFSDIGLACLHTQIDRAEENVQFLFRSSPRGSVSHSYADQNGFSLHAYGEPLAIASGYYIWYGSPHHVNWTWETKAANSITVDGVGQVKRSPLSRGSIVAFEHTAEADYVMGDATEAYGGRLCRFHRHVLFLRPGAFVILDDLESETESTFTWHLHALEQMRIDGKHVRIARGGARLSVHFLAPSDLTLAQTDQFDVPVEAEVPNQWHLTAATAAMKRVRFVTVLQPFKAGAPEPSEARLRPDGSVQIGDRVVRFEGGRLTWRRDG